MKIGFDAKRAAQNKTGLGNYSRFVIEGLSRFYPDNQYLLYTPNPKRNRLLGSLSNQSNCIVTYPEGSFWKRLSSLWRVIGINKQLINDKLSIFHGLSNELPLGIEKVKNTKSIVTIHDLIFLRYPEFYKPIDRKIYTYKFKKACQVADSIIAVSECTKRDIIQFFGIDEKKIQVIYQGCDSSFQQTATDEVKAKAKELYQLPENYLLYVGSIESRKNLKLIVEALTKTTCDLPLIAVGKHTPYADEVQQYINENGLKERVKMLHNVDFTYFPAIYQMASLFIYPSFFEGFGIPILEALYSRVPVIGTTGSCLEEAGGNSSIYVNPTDANEMASAIDRVMLNKELRQQMIDSGVEYANNFSQEHLSKQMMEHYNSLLSR